MLLIQKRERLLLAIFMAGRFWRFVDICLFLIVFLVIYRIPSCLYRRVFECLVSVSKLLASLHLSLRASALLYLSLLFACLAMSAFELSQVTAMTQEASGVERARRIPQCPTPCIWLRVAEMGEPGPGYSVFALTAHILERLSGLYERLVAGPPGQD